MKIKKFKNPEKYQEFLDFLRLAKIKYVKLKSFKGDYIVVYYSELKRQ